MTSTVLQYAVAIAKEIDDYVLYTVGSGANGANAVVLTSAVTVAGSSPNRFDGSWLYNMSTGESRLARAGGLTVATGVLAFDPPGTIPSAGQTVIMTKRFPMIEDIRPQTAYRSIVEGALAPILIPKQVPISMATTSAEGAPRYGISAYDWLDRQERFGWPPNADGTSPPLMWEPGPTRTSLVPATWRRPRLELDGDARYIAMDGPFVAGSSGTFYIAALVPANRYLNPGSGFAFVAGIASLSDSALPMIEDVKALGLVEVYRILMNRAASAPTGTDWAKKYADQQVIADEVLARLDPWKRKYHQTAAAALAATKATAASTLTGAA